MSMNGYKTAGERMGRTRSRDVFLDSGVVFACLSAVWMFACPEAAGAQYPDLVDISAQYLPGTSVQSGDGEAQVASYDVVLQAPIPLAERSFLIPGLAYHADAVSFSGVPDDFIQLRAFHSLDVTALFVQLLPRDWSLSARVAFGIASDKPGFGRAMYRFNAMLMANHAFNDTFVLGGGALFTYRFGSAFPLPAIFVKWEPIEQFALEAFLPAFVKLRYIPTERVEITAQLDVNGNSYAVRHSRVRHAWPCQPQEMDDPATPMDETVVDNSQCFDSLNYSVGTAGLDVAVRLFSSVWFHAFGGYTVFRRFERLNVEGDRIQDSDSLPLTWVVRAGLTWRIPGI